MRALAVTLRLTDHVLSHVTAAVVHHLPVPGLPLDVVHVTRPGRPGASRLEAGVKHHVCSLAADDRTTVDGLTVTGLERTALDVARGWDGRASLPVVDAALAGGADVEPVAAAGHHDRRLAGVLAGTSDARPRRPASGVTGREHQPLDVPRRRAAAGRACACRSRPTSARTGRTSPGSPPECSGSSTER
nr:hypothetical protein [Angustibacter aerolatus]